MKVFFKAFLFILLFANVNVFALSVEERLNDEELENRAMNLFLEVRCLVCQGQVIESSDTEFSAQLRKLIRDKIQDEKSDKQIKLELRKEFGEDILLKPDYKKQFLLWFLPFLSIFLAGFFLKKYFK